MEISCYDGIRYRITDGCVTIFDGYRTRRRRVMGKFIGALKEGYPSNPVLSGRSAGSLVAEWRTHNLLYDLGLFRSHTADTDLNSVPWYVDLAYRIVSAFYFG